MNARILVESRSAELDRSFIRRARSASRHELLLMKRAHASLGCCPVFGQYECWKCAALKRQDGRR